MKGLAQGAQRLSKSMGALGALTDRLATRAQPSCVKKAADDVDLFKAMPPAELPTYPESVSTQAATSPSARQEAGRYKPDSQVEETKPTTPQGNLTTVTGFRVDKYSPDQPRDERGRWTLGGVATAALATIGTGALIGGGILLARNPGLFRAVGRDMATIAGKPKPMRAGGAVKPKGAAAAPKASAKAPRATKPFADLSARQQQRRMAAARAEAVRRGATPKQADDIVAQMRARASTTTPRGSTRERVGPAVTSPQAIAMQRAHIESEKARLEVVRAQFNALAGKRGLSSKEKRMRMSAYIEIGNLERSIARREASIRLTIPKR